MKTKKLFKLLSSVLAVAGLLAFVFPVFFPALAFSAIMASIITPAQIDWDGEQVKSVQEAIMLDTFANPDLQLFHTIYQDIVAKKQIVYLGTLSKLTKIDPGCNTTAPAHSITMSQKYWDPSKTQWWLSQCANDLEESFFVWALNKGIERKDLTNGEFMAFLTERASEAVKEDILRIVWFNDTAAANVGDSPAGIITDGVSLTDYNIIDGLWKQIYAIVAAAPTQRYTITENAAVTKTLQDTLASDRSLATLRSLLQNCDKRLKNANDLVFIMTDSLVDNYQTYLENTNTLAGNTSNIEGRSTSQFDSGLKFRNIPIYRFDMWDRTIRADMDNGTTYYQPHRCILTTKSNLAVGCESIQAMTSMEAWYERKEQTTNLRGGFKIDAKIIKDYMIQVAY